MAKSREWPPHVSAFFENLRDVGKLIALHEYLGGTGPGRRNNIEVLNKSALVLLVACWEAYLEDLATQGFDFMLKNAANPSAFPGKVRALAARSLTEDPNPTRVWDLAGGGWRDVLVNHREEVLARTIGKFNTPRPGQVDSLFEELIGLKGLSSMWRWKGRTVVSAKAALDQLVTLRGDVAHRVTATRGVTKKDVEDGVNLIHRLAAISSNRVRTHIQVHLDGAVPWVEVGYGTSA